MSELLVSGDPLVFNWETPRRRSVALIGFLAVSFALHAAGFYVFQIAYPPAVSLPPQAARLSLITGNSEEGRIILRWLEAENPAVAASTLRPTDVKPVSLPSVQHIPSYAISEPALKDAPPLDVDLRMPSCQLIGPVLMRRTRPSQKVAAWPTRILFSQEIQDLGTPALPSLKFVASSNDAPQAVTFEVAVGPEGVVLYSFARNSSGDTELDEQARKYLAFCRFPGKATSTDAAGAGGSTPANMDLIWGTATVEWGNDVALPPAPPGSTTSPSP